VPSTANSRSDMQCLKRRANSEYADRFFALAAEGLRDCSCRSADCWSKCWAATAVSSSLGIAFEQHVVQLATATENKVRVTRSGARRGSI
jgi:hypothetical protein